MRSQTLRSALMCTIPFFALTACSDYRENEGDSPMMHEQEMRERDRAADRAEIYPIDAQGTVSRFREKDPSLAKFFDNSYAYAVFPKIGKGAAGIGAANGTGDAFERGRHVGTTEMTQITLGVQLGGQTYSEVIFFQDQAHFNVFKDGGLEFAANASAIAAESGKGATNDFQSGVAVFTIPRGGLMFEAAIGGQKFTYRPDAR